jgi:hypothetical protein
MILKSWGDIRKSSKLLLQITTLSISYKIFNKFLYGVHTR